MRSSLLILFFASVTFTSAQTWFTGNPYEDAVSSVKDGYLIVKVPVTVLDPPKITQMKITWDGLTGNWKIILLSEKPLPKEYKPCRIDFNGWNSYTVVAGDRDGGSFLEILMKSYEHSIELRDALIKQFKLKPEVVTTDPKDAEKKLK
jgi:hypothetical protein